MDSIEFHISSVEYVSEAGHVQRTDCSSSRSSSSANEGMHPVKQSVPVNGRIPSDEASIYELLNGTRGLENARWTCGNI
jgi:hypothetical protein